jgi:DNA mismatch repair protein MutL
MGKISRLKEEVFKKIAAGEVVERPSSAVKELVENSIDAGADLIEVELLEGGKELIQISDNGEGFLDEDIEIAFNSHSTSKIREIKDFDSLDTLGFRGEALPSIKEVAKIDLRTSSTEDGSGWHCRFADSVLKKKEKIVFRRGTQITVKELFHNFPVRKKFLKSERTELNRISKMLESIAMINHRISFRLTNNHREIFYYGSTREFKDRIYQIIGPDLYKSLEEINFSGGDYSIRGMISKINTGSSVKKHQYYYVNQRPVREASLIASVNNTFKKYLDKSKYPVAVLALNLPPCEVDVNIHPMKQEIKFHNNSFIYSFVKNAINSCLKTPIDVFVEAEMNFSNFREDISTEEKTAMKNSEENSNLESLNRRSLLPLSGQDGEVFKLLGQYRDSFIIVEKDSKLLIIDQHNAHERVNFDRLNKFHEQMNTEVASPLFPIIIELTPAESRSLTPQIEEVLKKVGFEIRKLSGNSIDLKTYPWFVEEKNIKDVIVSVLHMENRGSDLYTKVIGDIACKNSIKVNHSLDEVEMKKIITDLFKSSNPFFCPHKRPIIKEFSFEDIEKMVKRK